MTRGLEPVTRSEGQPDMTSLSRVLRQSLNIRLRDPGSGLFLAAGESSSNLNDKPILGVLDVMRWCDVVLVSKYREMGPCLPNANVLSCPTKRGREKSPLTGRRDVRRSHDRTTGIRKVFSLYVMDSYGTLDSLPVLQNVGFCTKPL